MTLFSANLGFLWTDLNLADGIRAAKNAGFDAVECHWPYAEDVDSVRSALVETDLSMISLNTVRGDFEAGENGLAAIFGRECDARKAIDQAIDFAVDIGAFNVHVMAGNTDGDAAHACFVFNLEYACRRAERVGITILIEPLNERDAPGYFLRTTEQAVSIIDELSVSNLKMMFDCYHVGITEGDVVERLRQCFGYVGHIQFASVPDRGAPDHGDVDYRVIFRELSRLGYTKPIGAEYHSLGDPKETLDWMSHLATDF